MSELTGSCADQSFALAFGAVGELPSGLLFLLLRNVA